MGGTVSDDRAVAGPPASAREEGLPRLEIALGLATVAYLAAEGIRAAPGSPDGASALLPCRS
jgi:hypothetical protein